jgi:hypothetical protein
MARSTREPAPRAGADRESGPRTGGSSTRVRCLAGRPLRRCEAAARAGILSRHLPALGSGAVDAPAPRGRCRPPQASAPRRFLCSTARRGRWRPCAACQRTRAAASRCGAPPVRAAAQRSAGESAAQHLPRAPTPARCTGRLRRVLLRPAAAPPLHPSCPHPTPPCPTPALTACCSAGDALVFVAWPHTAANFPALSQRLGIVFCFNRPCALHTLRWPQPAAAAVRLTPGLGSAFSPRFDPGGGTLVFLSQHRAVETGVHSATASLWALDWQASLLSWRACLDELASCLSQGPLTRLAPVGLGRWRRTAGAARARRQAALQGDRRRWGS